MNRWLLSLLCLFFPCLLSGQQQEEHTHKESLDELVEQYACLYKETQRLIDSLCNKQHTGDWRLLQKSNATPSQDETDRIISPLTTWDKLSLQWVSDINHNFTPGIFESEDLFYRSRISTGLDWLVFGQGSKKALQQDYGIQQKEMQKDSIENAIRKKDLFLAERKLLIQTIFEQEKYRVLTAYQSLAEALYAFQQTKHKLGLANDIALAWAKKELTDVTIKRNALWPADSSSTAHINQFSALLHAELPKLPPLEELNWDQLLQEEEKLLLLT